MMKHTNILLCFFTICMLGYGRVAFSEEDGDLNKLMDVENEVNDLKERFLNRRRHCVS